MSRLAKLLILVCISWLYGTEKLNGLETQYVQVDRLSRDTLTSKFKEIFTPQLISDDNRIAEHSVHVEDKHGKFMKLEYRAEHPANSQFFKMDESPHKDNIVSVECNEDSQMILTFKDSATRNEVLHYSLLPQLQVTITITLLDHICGFVEIMKQIDIHQFYVKFKKQK